MIEYIIVNISQKELYDSDGYHDTMQTACCREDCNWETATEEEYKEIMNTVANINHFRHKIDKNYNGYDFLYIVRKVDLSNNADMPFKDLADAANNLENEEKKRMAEENKKRTERAKKAAATKKAKELEKLKEKLAKLEKEVDNTE